MISSVYKKIVQATLLVCLVFCLIFSPFTQSAEAGRTSMTGDYVKDTVTVAKSLREAISTTQGNGENEESDKDAVFLITDYISRYRNRSQINGTVSFTTMQTALNSLAGHYKTFPNRPVPENLQNRLNEELSKAEQLVLKES